MTGLSGPAFVVRRYRHAALPQLYRPDRRSAAAQYQRPSPADEVCEPDLAQNWSTKPLELNHKHLVSPNSQQGEDACGVSSSIDVDSVRSDVGFGDGCMTVHDEFVEALVI